MRNGLFRRVKNLSFSHTPPSPPSSSAPHQHCLMEAIDGAIPDDEKIASDLAGPGYHINRSNLLVLESKADMQRRAQASPDDGEVLALTFAAVVAPAGRARRGRGVRTLFRVWTNGLDALI